MDINRLTKRHMNRRATSEEQAYLYTHVDEWRKELIKILNVYFSELQSIRSKQAEDMKRYEADEDLQAKAFEAWEEKRLQAAQQLRRAEYDLTLLDQWRQAEVGPPMTDRERFLVAAIEAHRDFVGEIRPVDESLYDALEGKWTYTDLPEELPWQE